MVPRLEWVRGPISGRLILYADGALWPRIELVPGGGGELDVVLFTTESASSVIGRFSSAAEARPAAEQALTTAAIAVARASSARHSA